MNQALSLLLGILLTSFAFTSAAIVPFINMLYHLKFQRARQISKDVFGELTSVFNKFHQHKGGIPVGGGLLVIAVVSILFGVLIPVLENVGIPITSVHANGWAEVIILFFTFITFGLLGLYDDTKKFFKLPRAGFFGMSMKQKFLIQLLLGFIIASMLFFWLQISILNIPFIGTFELGWLYLPFATFTIVAFANAVNITDGLDGLASGSLMISLFGLWFISATILDLPLSVFIALWIGALISFLYFNVFPARLFMGDVGSLSFGATLAVIGLLLGKPFALVIIGFIFVIEIATSLMQLLSKRFLHRKLIPAAPLHLTLQKYGWEEPKIVQRAWLVQILLTIFGLWLTTVH